MIDGGARRVAVAWAVTVARKSWKPGLLGLLLATTALQHAPLASGTPQVAQQARTVAFAIPAGPLPGVLAAYGQATGLQVMYAADIARGVASPGVTGALAPREALVRLLAGTGLTARFVDPDTVTLEKPVAGGAVLLDPVTVQAANARDRGRTEGTGSYATSSTNSATKLNLSPRETPQSVSVMTRQRMEDQGLNEIQDVLDQTVGLTLVESGALGTDGNSVYSRGFAVSNYQVDGVPRSTVYGFSDAISDMAVFDRVEVVRGATGLLNGVGDPSAAVNLVRKRPTAAFTGTVEGQIGSWDRYRGEADVSGPLVEGGRLRGRFVAARQDNDSFIDRLQQRKTVLYGTLEADLTPDTLWSVGLEYQKHKSDHASRGGFPLFYADNTRTDFSRSINSGANWGYFTHDNLTAFTELKHRFGDGWSATLNVEHSRREYDGLLGYGLRGSLDRATGSGMGVWAGRWNSELQQTSVSADVTGPFELFGRKHDLMAGVSGYHANGSGADYPLWYLDGYSGSIGNYYTWNGNIAEPTLNPTGQSETTERQMAAYLATRLKPTDDLSVILGSRISRWQQTEDSRPNGGTATTTSRSANGVVTPYAGIVYDLTDQWSVYASYTSIFKPQTQKDSSGQTLDPLEGNAYEVGVKAEFFGGALNGSLALFKIEQDNLAVADPGRFTPDGSQAYKAAKGTKSKGVELELSGELSPGWQVGGGYSHAVPEDANGNQLLTYVPTDTVKLFTTYRLPGAWDRLTIGGNVKWQSDIASGNAARRYVQESVTLIDLMARYQLTDSVAATLNVNNLFDKTYMTDINNAGYYGEPRSALLSLRARW